ncbi:ComF family protein [Marinovum sp. 2_MG-2023]|uniref:ComF family protein n=1 Tax=unclassified Marinovum TaxID=2647166 RepID=UPI0026E40BE7|nr:MULTISPECIES: ComF family protein [unclassified Marinovum]MDO6730573.1 ComF family protein [Marinovum sp. 2_MG-2023]MDO6778723.1 ComF family protein [Marinovum sp. 1_MG-2023]
MSEIVQTALRVVYPSQCLICRDLVETDFGLCGACWRDTPFTGGLVCDCCGVPLPGENTEEIAHCDSCISAPPAWDRGRAALLYRDNGRRIVMGLKHNDRQDIAPVGAKWLARAVGPLILPDMLVAPVPLHWMRMMSRRYNQSALLAESLARELGLAYCPDLLKRVRRTRSLDRFSGAERREILDGAIQMHRGRRGRVAGGRPVLLIDDVLTTGATLGACAEVLRASGAGPLCIGALARVSRDD